jgi:hypothetical protein
VSQPTPLTTIPSLWRLPSLDQRNRARRPFWCTPFGLGTFEPQKSTPFLPLSDLLNNVLRDTPQKANS